MPLLNGSSREVISENIAELRRSGYDEPQATAIAYRKAREAGKKDDPPEPKPIAPKQDETSGGEGDSTVDRLSFS